MAPAILTSEIRAHQERLRDRPCDAAATSIRTVQPELRNKVGNDARCQCLTDEQPRAVFRSRRSERVETTEETHGYWYGVAVSRMRA